MLRRAAARRKWSISATATKQRSWLSSNIDPKIVSNDTKRSFDRYQLSLYCGVNSPWIARSSKRPAPEGNLMTSARSSQSIRLPAQDLARLAARLAASLFAAAGMEADKADCMGRLLLLTDMMGRHTHGLAQCAAYLKEI